MQTRVILFVLAAVAVSQAARKRIWGSDEERKAIMEEAMSEAKLSAQLREETQKARALEIEKGPATVQTIINRGFKKPSEMAIKQGKARLLMEDMVFRAERKLEELKKKDEAVAASDEDKAETLAEELYHTPGTLLKEDELAKMYIESECLDERRLEIDCRFIPTVNLYRQIDGTCNNFENPLQGASDTALRRLAPSHYEDGISELRGFRQSLDVATAFSPPQPSARLVSTTVVRDRVRFESPFSHLLMQFGQFIDHDLDLSPELETECEGCEVTEICSPIRVRNDDPQFGLGTENNADCLPFRRALPVCDSGNEREFEAREQINALTSYIDASMVYGSNRRQGEAVRGEDGLLLVESDPFGDGDKLPVDKDDIVACPGRSPRDCFLTGDVRGNEQISLTIMHTLWVREHNRIAKELKRLNPVWSDEIIYEEARKIVGAIIQKIVYYDYLPLILGDDVFDQVIGPYRGYKPDVDASVPNVFATGAYRYGHSLIRPRFPRLRPDFRNAQTPLELQDMFFNPPLYRQSGGVGQVVRGLISNPSRQVDEFLNIVLTTKLFQVSFRGPGMDLAALNMQRARDHGLPTYGVWKAFCENRFPDLDTSDFQNMVTKTRLSRLYGGNLELIEMWLGGLGEERLPGSLIGLTFSCLFGITFQDVRDGDRFYFERPGVFTSAQVEAIKKTSFSRVICDNTDTTSIQTDAFIVGTSRFPCTGSVRIPELDLTPWIERDCFLPIGVPNGQQIVAFSQLDRVPKFRLFTNQDDGVSECLPVLCPTGNTFVNVFAFANPNFRSCTVNGAGNILYNRFRENDVFTTVGACRAARPSVTFTCSGTAQSSTQSSDNPESIFYEGKLPEEVAKKIEEQFNIQQQYEAANQVVVQSAKTNKTKQQLLKPEIQEEEDLLSELQEALKKLD